MALSSATERSRAADVRLRALELENAALYEGAATGYVTLDAEGRIERINPVAAALLGAGPPDLAGRPFSDFVERLDRPALQRFCDRIRRGENPGGCELSLGDAATRMRSVRLVGVVAIGEARCRIAVSDVTEQRSASDALSRSEARLRSAYRRLAQAQENERLRLTGQLHDQVGRNLTALGLQLAMLEPDVPAGAARGRLDEANALLRASVAQVRSVMSDLYPPMLLDYGLYSAVRWWVGEVARRSSAELRMVEGDGGWRLHPDSEAGLFRIAQEALENAVRHADATRIEVSVRAGERQVELVVDDDGHGFDAGALAADDTRSSWGLTFMRERALAIGALLEIDTRPGRGTRVRVCVERAPR